MTAQLLWEILCLYLIIQIIKGQECLKVGNGNGPPLFQSYRNGDEITLHHQAIITSYKLNCNQMCGNITAWGVDVQPGGNNHNNGRYSLDLQVWRPSPTVDDSTGTGCYSLVGNNRFTSITFSDNLVRVTPSPQDYIQFQPGDVLGFYVEEAREADNGVVILSSPSSFASELVWYASIAPTTATSQNGDCPYSVGSSGVLNTTTQAAPVISIAIVPCPSKATTTSPSMTSPPVTSLIAGVVIATVIAIIALTLLTVVTIALVVMRCRKKATNFNIVGKNLALNNKTYGKNVTVASRLTDRTYEYIDLTRQNSGRPSLAVRYTPSRDPEAVHIYTDSTGPPVNHSTNVRGQSPRPPLPLPRIELVSANIEKDNDSAQIGITDSCIDADNLSSLNTSHSRTKVDKNEEVFERAGIYVPTLEERARLNGHYVMQETRDYNKLKFFEEEKKYWAPANTKLDLYVQLSSKKYREIPRSQIKISTKVGSGQFGEVCKAIWSVSGTTKEIAIKALKPGSREDEKLKLLQEAAIMGQFFHPNVVRLYGVVTVDEPVIICLEMMANGDLRNYLDSISPKKLSSRALESQFLRFSKQIAEGMNYLASKSFIHRDLAARNILLDESLTCKIGDFGMARNLMDETYYTAKSKDTRIPVKWTAPEALHYKKYSTDSDVWSYGMVLFEIWSVGKKPFSQCSNTEVLGLVQTGHCQPPPPGCPRAIYKLMIDCWNPNHSDRPTFSKISHHLMSSSNKKLLEWTTEEAVETSSPRARELGAPLSEGKDLYKDLQNTYYNKSTSTV